MSSWGDTLSLPQTHIDKLVANRNFTITSELAQKGNIEDFNKHKKHRIRLDLHATMLSEYIKAHMIPRGLRIKKYPGMFREDEAFKQKWIAVLNKCSLDLMSILIERLNTEIAQVEQQLEDMNYKPEEDTNVDLESIDQQLQEYHNFIQTQKMKKLNRDRNDYKNNIVYPWMQNTYRPRYKRRVRFEGNSFTSLSSTTEGESNTEDPDERNKTRDYRQTPGPNRQYNRDFPTRRSQRKKNTQPQGDFQHGVTREKT